MQGFNWDSWNKQGGWYNMLKGQVGDIAGAGVTHVWLPPPSHSVSSQGKSTFYGSRVLLLPQCILRVNWHAS